MLRYLSQPIYTGILVRRVGFPGPNIDLARDGLVDDGLLLLLQQFDQLLLGADVAPDTPVGMVEKTDDRSLLRDWWKWKRGSEKGLVGQL